MRDVLLGRVENVIDEETFQLDIIQMVRNTPREYEFKEKIRIKRIECKDNLLLKYRNPLKEKNSDLFGRRVMCLTLDRDPSGFIESDVLVID